MGKKLFLWFDVEDYVTPESDDAFYDLLVLMDKYGIKSTIKFCTKKLRLIKERGRTDIIKKLAQHEMAFHTINHSVHPLPTEYLEGYNFKDGAIEFDKREKEGIKEVAEIAGQYPTSYGQPGVAWAPAVFPSLVKNGIFTYLDYHPIINVDGKPFWYGGVLYLSNLKYLLHIKKDKTYGQLMKFYESIEEYEDENVFISLYDHPTELCTSEFWDEVNFSYGKNPNYLKPAPLVDKETRDALFNEYEEFFRATIEDPSLEYITAKEVFKYLKYNLKKLTPEDIEGMEYKSYDEVDYARIRNEYYSPSEVMILLSKYFLNLPLASELMYGPNEARESIITSQEIVSVEVLSKAILNQYETIFGLKQMPEYYHINGNLINPVDAFATLMYAMEQKLREVEWKTGKFSIERFVEPYKFGGNWVLWDPDFNPKEIVKQTRIQCWTLKPVNQESKHSS